MSGTVSRACRCYGTRTLDIRIGRLQEAADGHGWKSKLFESKERSGCHEGEDIFFTGSGPIVILTSYASLKDSRLVEKLATKGIKEFVAFEVPPDMAKEKGTGIITMLSLATFTSRMTYGYSITMGIMSSTSFV